MSLMRSPLKLTGNPGWDFVHLFLRRNNWETREISHSLTSVSHRSHSCLGEMNGTLLRSLLQLLFPLGSTTFISKVDRLYLLPLCHIASLFSKNYYKHFSESQLFQWVTCSFITKNRYVFVAPEQCTEDWVKYKYALEHWMCMTPLLKIVWINCINSMFKATMDLNLTFFSFFLLLSSVWTVEGIEHGLRFCV